MKICSRCIMPETAQGIILDENGLCQLCRDFRGTAPLGEQELRQEISNFVDENAEFNCIVPVSGGRDSAYALFYAKKVLGLKPIAVHNDNDFETEIAGENLDNMVQNLDVPLVRVRSQKLISKKIVAEKFKMNAVYGPGLVVEQTCEACKYGFESASYNTARKNDIKLIIWGDSREESTTPYHLLIEHKTPSKWKRLFNQGCLSYFKYKYYFRKMKKEYGPDLSNGLKEIHFYDYIEWDRKVMLETIQDNLGWSKPKDSATSWRIDCSLIPLVDYLTVKAYGVSKMELGFSSMIRCGKMDREDALRQVAEIKNSIKIEELESFLRQLNIPSACASKVLK